MVVAIVTMPFDFEHRYRTETAQAALVHVRSEVDAIIVVPNQNLFRVANERTTFSDAFRISDHALEICASSIVRALTSNSSLNLLKSDLAKFFRDGSMLFVGRGHGRGPKRYSQAVEEALSSWLLSVDPLSLKNQPIFVHVRSRSKVTMLELDRVSMLIEDEVAGTPDTFFATSTHDELTDELCVEIIAVQNT